MQARNRKGAAAGLNSGGGLGTGSNSSNAQKSIASANARKKDSSSSTGTPSINGSNTSGGGGGGGGGGASVNNTKSMNQLKSQFFVMTPTHMFLGCCCLLIASYFCYIGYLETRVNTPFDDNKVSCGFYLPCGE